MANLPRGERRRPDRVNLNPHLTGFIRQFTWRTQRAELVCVSFKRLSAALAAVVFWITDRSLDDFIKTRLRWAACRYSCSLILMSAIVFLNIFFRRPAHARCPVTAVRYFCVAGVLDDVMENCDCGEKPTT
jgi:hypothetical protein